MTTVVLTKIFSGFANRPDTWVIGEEPDLPGRNPCPYDLPEGYTMAESQHMGIIIYDPDYTPCELGTHPNGEPQLYSTGARGWPVLKRSKDV